MTLGALVDLGVPVEWLKRRFEEMPLPDADIRAKNIWHNGIKAVNFFVDEKNSDISHDHIHSHNHSEHHHTHSNTNSGHHHTHSNNHLEHHHTHSHNNSGHHHARSRNYLQIKELVLASPFSEYVKSSTLKAFEKIALAESAVHGTPIEQVHFHEVGGVDAIVDITGTFLCMEYLGITKVYGSIPSLGKGSVKCSHGVIPVPAPATLKILKGIPVKASDSNMELVTPTGAAIITTLTRDFGDIPDMVIKDTGYGSGKKKSASGLPNVLRVITGEFELREQSVLQVSKNPNIFRENVYVIETSIDDMNPEIAGYIMERLFEKGALDVSCLPLQMKKNRPAFKLEVICRKMNLDELVEIILTESTSSGVRFYQVDRALLARQNVEMETPFGKLTVKQITDPAGKTRIVPEYEVCRKIAREQNIPVKDVYFLIERTGLN
ncbi:MAG: nickel pincer cofactor biosynthesis protein LarC [Desulfamplus sp.]|nr:nickel pincer cofactor biosynthesis protein LarC [Desulfamplus sp.]